MRDWRLSVGLVLALILHPGKSSAQTFTDPGFGTEVVATLAPFTLVGMAWAPDGRLFIWQKNGVVRVVKQGVLLPTPFIDLSARVNSFDDRGLWGLAFHPNFASNGYVYMTYVFENAGNPNSSAPRTSRLTRITANPSNPDVALAGSEVVILGSVGTPPCSAQPPGADCIAADGGGHVLGTIRFAPDGKMFLGNGDGADAAFADPLALRAQDLTSWNGKIMRLNDDGTAPTDNPFYDGTNSVRSKVWLYGVRNPFRFAIHPTTGEIYFGDVGWNTWEEVDRGTPGSNYGWPCYEGTGPQPTYQNQFPLCQQLPASAVVPPVYTYNQSMGTAVIGSPFYSATVYPLQYRGNFFFADYSGNWIRRLTFDANDNPVGVQNFADDVEAPVTMELGPDGMIYYLSFTTGEIRRIRYNGPVAAASASPTNGYAPLTVSFSSAGSSNSGGGPLSYLWNFGDNTTSTQPNPTHTYTPAGVSTFTARLTVTNQTNQSSSATVAITVGSTPPTPTISNPADGTAVQPGQTVVFQGSATDPDQGQLAPSALRWTVLLHHNTHVHTFVGGTGSQGSFVAENHGSVGSFSYEIILTATDSSGLEGSTSVELPVVPDMTLPSAPSGLMATPVSSAQVNLSWTAATDNVGVAGYRVERCQGAGCTTFAQIATPAGTSFIDRGRTTATSYSYRVRAADASGNLGAYSNVDSTITASTPPAPGLVAAYGAEEGTDATLNDASGNGNNGTISGATWTTQGRYGTALTFNGSNNRVRVPSSSSLNLSTAMTLEAWIRPTASQSGWRTIVQKEVDAYFLNASNTTGPLRPSGGGTFAGNVAYVSGTTANPVNAWTHVALTYNGTTLRLYVNGTQVTSAARTGSIQISGNPLWIGGNNPYGEYFRGLIDEVRIYNRALTQTEIQTDMATRVEPSDATPPSTTSSTTPSTTTSSTTTSTTASSTTSSTTLPPSAGLVAAYAADENGGATLNDLSGNGNTGTITGATWTTQGKYGSALSFNATGHRVRVPSSSSLNLSSAMTLEAWIRPTATQSGWRTIVQKETDAYFLNASNSSGPLRPSGGGTFNGTVAFVSGTTANPVNAWTHVALTYDGARLRLYVNATLVTSSARTGSIQTTTNPLWIGGNSPYGEYFRGLIDEVRIYNRALIQTEIANDMATRIAP